MVQNSATLMSDTITIYINETDGVKDAENIVSSCVFQPITTDQTSYFSKNGGDALGLSSADGPLNWTCRHLPSLPPVTI
jgi:hypothetical protein